MRPQNENRCTSKSVFVKCVCYFMMNEIKSQKKTGIISDASGAWIGQMDFLLFQVSFSFLRNFCIYFTSRQLHWFVWYIIGRRSPGKCSWLNIVMSKIMYRFLHAAVQFRLYSVNRVISARLGWLNKKIVSMQILCSIACASGLRGIRLCDLCKS